MRTLGALILGLLLAACGEQDVPPPDQQARPSIDRAAATARFNQWLDGQFEESLRFSPEYRTVLGDKTDYHLLDDRSEQAIFESHAWERESVATMQRDFDYAQLDAEGQLSWDLWQYNFELSEQSMAFMRHHYIFGRGGPHAGLPNFLINYHRIDSADDARAYVSRLAALPRAFEQLLERAMLAAGQGIRPPRFDYEFAIEEIRRVTDGAPFSAGEDSALLADFRGKMQALVTSGTIGSAEAEALLAEATAILAGSVQEAYATLLAWLQTDLPNSDAEPRGVWNLPDGEAFYDFQLRAVSGEDLTADEIHQIGLSEVDRLMGEMDAIRRQVGFEGTMQDFFRFMRESEQFYLPDNDAGRQAYLDLAREYLAGVELKLPEYFGRLPKAALEVRRVEAFREQDGAAQHYASGAPDGSRAGVFYAHLSDMRAMPVFQLEDVAYHEGVPGHHMQISIQQELTEIPRFRTQSRNTAYTEGWALYAEALAKEMGFFQDPYSEFGRLTGEMWRAIRLVLDTGIHSKQWSEEQAVAYMLANAALAEGAVRSEVRRYITSPGQATGYKLGMMKFQELRERARDRLGAGFDVREFHDLVLGAGALPLPILEARVERWLDTGRI